ncbi:MAG TPA: hypothetical protein PKA28_17670 [Methylomusa anaerophila]|uniref:Uncharacterized protein n=1 Tax=Methylomusa anaerophila TaxID=1930071 RepID=A0A348AMH0_9FIRM|nr:hypothetical protein [Methylomusa anaerophila]BBB92268.1 hypothetical protein MAMMFC1_02953 [Methylomusa anaerophila]HML90273.1 hypothetical protein [Methylomusa anaerophila]
MFNYPDFQDQEYYDRDLKERIEAIEKDLEWEVMLKLFRDEYIDVNNKFMSTKLQIDSPRIYNAIFYRTQKGIKKVVDELGCKGTTRCCAKEGEASPKELEDFNNYLKIKFLLDKNMSYEQIANEIGTTKQNVHKKYKRLMEKYE